MRKLSEIDPSSVLAHTNMSLFLMKQGKIDEAEEQKSQATIKSFQSFGKEAKSKEAEELAQKQKQAEWEQREGMFKQVLEIDPEDTLANYGLGSIAVEKKEFERARQHLEKVIMVDPKYSVAYLALGRAYLGLQAKEDAKACFQEGVKVAASKGDMMPANQMQMELDQLSL
jgi:tetratricopeptide (TPR) repeat protein